MGPQNHSSRVAIAIGTPTSRVITIQTTYVENSRERKKKKAKRCETVHSSLAYCVRALHSHPVDPAYTTPTRGRKTPTPTHTDIESGISNKTEEWDIKIGTAEQRMC